MSRDKGAITPVAGTPPTLEWVATDRLSTDPSYQREAIDARLQKLITSIARGFSWALCQPLSCCRRPDGAIVVIDGQHRLLGARARGDVAHLPCVIVASETEADEAKLFADLNRKRKPLSSFEVWRAALAAGDPEATEAFQLLEASGLTLATHTNYASWKPGTFGALSSVVRQIRAHGARATGMALEAMGEAWPDEALTQGSGLVRGMAPFYAALPDDFDPDLFIEILGGRMQDDWVDEAKARAALQSIDHGTALHFNLENAYDAATRKGRR